MLCCYCFRYEQTSLSSLLYVMPTGKTRLASVLVRLLLIILTLNVSLSAQSCFLRLSSRLENPTTVYLSGGLATPDQPCDDSACCLSCSCCHGYALLRLVMLCVELHSAETICLHASGQTLRGTALLIETPPRSYWFSKQIG